MFIFKQISFKIFFVSINVYFLIMKTVLIIILGSNHVFIFFHTLTQYFALSKDKTYMSEVFP